MKIRLFILLPLFLFSGIPLSAQKDCTQSKKVFKKKQGKRKKYKLPTIDLAHWKVTIPEGKGNRPIEVAPPQILDYATNDTLKPYMYNDSIRGALVFYAYPSEATTTNTKYSRSELREQIEPGNNNANWTFAQGGTIKAKIQMGKVSKDVDNDYHKVIIMQIHGRLSNEQKELIGAKDNNAPPVLKVYWQNGKIRVKTKVLKNKHISDIEILHEDAWIDDDGFNFEEKVGFDKFIIEVKVSEGKLVVSLNKNEYKVYENFSLKRWGIFENYFKAGNYLQTRDNGAYAKVKFYNLEVTH